VNIKAVRMLFNKDLEEMLMFESKDGNVIIRPRQYLGSDSFSKIASIVREVNGEYVSAGKDSHFRIPEDESTPKSQVQPSEQQERREHMIDLPHFNRERQLTSCLQMDEAQDGTGIFVSLIGNARDMTSGNNKKTTTKLGDSEVALVFAKLLKYLLR